MKKEDIITLPHPHLRQRSQKVGIITPEIKQITHDMEAATIDWEASREHEVGVALAAVQVNLMYRIVVVRNDFNNKDDRSFSVFINPQITKYEGDIEEDFEGCLSIKDVYGKVPRHTKVRVKATDAEGKEVRVTAEGFLARIFHFNFTVRFFYISISSPLPFCFLSLSGPRTSYNHSLLNAMVTR